MTSQEDRFSFVHVSHTISSRLICLAAGNVFIYYPFCAVACGKSGGFSWTGIYTPSAHYRQYWRLDRPRSLRPDINLPVEPTIRLSVSLSGTHFGTGCRTGDPFSWIGEDEDTRRPLTWESFSSGMGNSLPRRFFSGSGPFPGQVGMLLALGGKIGICPPLLGPRLPHPRG